MLSFHRKLGFAAFAGVGLLIGAASTPARADTHMQAVERNALATNDIHLQALTASGLIASGSALGDLNGVVVEAVTLPQTLEY
jgi:hypothetical protein